MYICKRRHCEFGYAQGKKLSYEHRCVYALKIQAHVNNPISPLNMY